MTDEGNLQRTFIAVPLPHQITDSILERTASLRRSSPRIKWEPPSKWHCTLKFLGDTTSKQLESLKVRLREEFSTAQSFECSLGACGIFFIRRDPRIVWIGLEPEEPFRRLADSADRLARSIVFPHADKQFKAHCTIGRIRILLDQSEVESLLGDAKSITLDDVHFVCNTIVLYQSTLHPHGSEYVELATVTLQ